MIRGESDTTGVFSRSRGFQDGYPYSSGHTEIACLRGLEIALVASGDGLDQTVDTVSHVLSLPRLRARLSIHQVHRLFQVNEERTGPGGGREEGGLSGGDHPPAAINRQKRQVPHDTREKMTPTTPFTFG